jgi:dihydroflavonol-4-reductase
MTTIRQPVCVTGASGFIASQLVGDLLERGYTVRGTVRDASSDRYDFLRELPGASERLELVSANLLEPASFDAAVAGCEVVHHTASPYALSVEDPQRDLVDPAVKGTQGVLQASAQAGVKRVVLTSSMAAVTDEPEDGKVLTEADWNEKSSLERNPYYYSKTLAEKAAWRFVEEKSPPFDLVVINPFLVIGPALTQSLNTSNGVLRDLLTGVYPGVLRICWGVVDVRDVARAHVLAQETPAAQGRHLCAREVVNMRDMVERLSAEGFGDYKLPSLGLDCALGDYVIRLASYFQPKGVGSYLRTHIGRTLSFDNTKIKAELGLEFRDLGDTLRDTVKDLIRWEHVPKK